MNPPARLAEAVEQLQLPLFLLDGGGQVLELNAAAAATVGRPAAALIGAAFPDLVDVYSREKAKGVLTAALSEGTAADWELNHPRADGPPILVTYYAWSWKPSANERVHVALIGQPLDAATSLAAQLAEANQRLEGALSQLERAHAELKETQAQLVRAEKLRAVGQLVAGVAHEINTPLGFVANNLTYIAEQLGELRPEGGAELWDDLSDAVAESQGGLQRISGIVRALRTFARPDTSSQEPADLNAGLAATVRIARAAAPAGVSITERYGELAPIICHPGEVNQVLLNLLTNAVQAVGAGGVVSVSSGHEGAWAVFRVSDNGAGMDEQTLARLGEPFFTTRDVGAGTGLGIAISLGIVRRHGGTLSFESTPGRGTTATLRLPVDERYSGERNP